MGVFRIYLQIRFHRVSNIGLLSEKILPKTILSSFLTVYYLIPLINLIDLFKRMININNLEIENFQKF